MKMLVWACALALGLALPGAPPPTFRCRLPATPDIFVLSLYHTKLESGPSAQFGRARRTR